MKKYLFSLMLSTAFCAACPAEAMTEHVEFTRATYPIKFEKQAAQKLHIVTDTDQNAHYQGESKKIFC